MEKIGKYLFKYRSYTPIPFLILMMIFFKGNTLSMIIGALIILTGEGIRIWGVAYAGAITRVTKNIKAHYLVIEGPFSFVRNPLYLGNIMIYTGYAVFSLALFPYLLLLALFWFLFQYSMIVKSEEEYLENQFEDEYRSYKKAVPRFLPRITPYRKTRDINVSPVLSKALKSERRTIQAISVVAVLSLIIFYLR